MNVSDAVAGYRSTILRDEWSVDVDRARVTIVTIV